MKSFSLFMKIESTNVSALAVIGSINILPIVEIMT